MTEGEKAKTKNHEGGFGMKALRNKNKNRRGKYFTSKRYPRFNTVFKEGNRKIGFDTLIFNLCSAHDCPSRKLGLCQLPDENSCYAYRDERRYPDTLAYRRRQECYWNTVTAEEFVGDVLAITNRKNGRISSICDLTRRGISGGSGT